MREVEDRTVYEPPGWLLADPCPDEPEAYPVAFSHGTSEATGAAITAQVVFTGTDYSGRPGNYFAHALVTGTPEQDFGQLLPVELWGAELWRTSPVDGTELPELPGPPPPGAVDRPGAQAFLDARGAGGVLPELLTAVGRAMAGERPVLVVSHDVSENIWWIAAISYLLGEHLGHRMTFTTYSHRPGYSRYHLTGILPETLAAQRRLELPAVRSGRRAGAGRRHPPAGRHPGQHRRDGRARAVAAGAGVRLGGGGEPRRLARARRDGGRPARPGAVPRRDGRGRRLAARRGRVDAGGARRRGPRRGPGPAGRDAPRPAAARPARPGLAAARPGPGGTAGAPAGRSVGHPS